MDDAWKADLIYMSNQDTDATPRVDQWNNGTDVAAELKRIMAVRRAALNRFDETVIKKDAPMATMEEALVPLYMYHRYAIESAASALGGQDYIYAFRGDDRIPTKWVSAAQQRAALTALVTSLSPAELALPKNALLKIPPRPSGWGMHRELFTRYTGEVFDPISPASAAADVTIGFILSPDRAARMVAQHARRPDAAGARRRHRVAAQGDVRRRRRPRPYEQEIRRATARVLVDRLMALAGGAPMPQVRAIASRGAAASQTTASRAGTPAATGDGAARR